MYKGIRSIFNLPKKQCTACGACNNICPNNSIDMLEDNEGFLYPHANKKKCLGCGKCEVSCPTLSKPRCQNQLKPKIYAAWSIDDEIHRESSSGGIFTELARSILYEGGYVAGARYNKSHLVEHFIVDNEKDLSVLRQSKYIQSEIGQNFKAIKMLLDEDKSVMFVGTPCQVAGLLSFLGRPYKKLLMCDLVCHGVNSPLVYRNYLKELEFTYGSKVKSINFRDKSNGWKHFGTRIIFENNTEYYREQRTEPFYRGFIKNLYLRPSCYECQYKTFPRHSDITLADFWGIEFANKNFYIDNGVSLIMIHSKKGQKYFDNLGSRIFNQEHSLEAALSGNPSIICPSKVAENKRQDFFDIIGKGKKISTAIENLI